MAKSLGRIISPEIVYSAFLLTFHYELEIQGIFKTFHTFIFLWETVRAGGVVIGHV
jgi:hypothetical protein